MALQITTERTRTPKEKPEGTGLGFGKYFTDHMFLADYSQEKGWFDARIVPYGPMQLEPACMVFHYGQELFEGLKAFRGPKGEICLFRPEMNARRMNISSERMCMPAFPEEDFLKALIQLVKTDEDWIPSAPETSLYIRPFIFATDAQLGVHPSETYRFVIILSPCGSYYATGFAPVKIYVEDEYIRAAPGGTGFAKCGGNYAGSLLAQKNAHAKGYSQVLWLDGQEKKYVEEVGAMNIMFKIDGKIVTAPLHGTILPGVTRNSCITLLKDWGMEVQERPLSIDEIMDAWKNGKLEEVFSTGTAASISPVGEICYKGVPMVINDFKVGQVSQKLYDTILGIQGGRLEDKYGWIKKL